MKKQGFNQTFLLLLFAFLIAGVLVACSGSKKKKRPSVSPVAQLIDTNMIETQALGMGWYSYIDNERKFRFKLPRPNASDMVENNNTLRFVGWMQPDTSAFKAGLLTYLADERGFLFQVYQRPYFSFGKEYFDFEELAADFYRTHANYKKRRLENGQYTTFQDSSITAFMFDTEIDFGEGKRTPAFYEAERLEDPYENTLQRTPAQVVYISHKRYNFRIIYEKNNSLAEGIFSSLIFF